MPHRTGLILAYDRSTFSADDQHELEMLSPYFDLVKIGLEAMMAKNEDGESIADLVSAFTGELEKQSMWDCKLHDIGNTVERAIRNIAEGRPSIKLLTLHATMSDQALKSAANACLEADIMPLAVTVLTDIDEEQSGFRFGRTPADAVDAFALNAHRAGINGLVCSPKELERVRDTGMTTVIPGIRPQWAGADDQQRIMTPAGAARAGAHYIVVGRPILQPPKTMTAVEAARLICEELDGTFPPGSFVDKKA